MSGVDDINNVGIFQSLSMSLRRQSRRQSTWFDIPITLSELDTLMAARQSEAIAKLDELGGVSGLCSRLKTSAENGLSGHPDDITARKTRFGENFIPPPKATPYWKLAWEAFMDTTLLILTVSAVISIALSFQPVQELPEEVSEMGFAIEAGDPYGWVEGAAILAAVIVIVNVTAWNDWQKDQQFRKLQDKVKSDTTYTAIRNGTNAAIKTRDIVVGDICQLKYGDVLPVDGILIHGNDLRIDESSLTGESDLVKKHHEEDVILLSGTRIMEGSGKMVVTAVGLNSQSGKIFSLIAGQDAEKKDEKKKSESKEKLNSSNNHQFYGATADAALTSLTMSVEAVKKNKDKERKEDEEKEASQSLLQDKVNRITTVLGYLGISIALGTIIILSVRFSITFFAIYGFPWDSAYLNVYVSYFINGIVILVIAVPEGLPAAVTIALAYSVRRMLEDNNLVRHLYACSTMGNATTVCTDKTGTLTTNRMTVVSSYICGRYLSDRPAKSTEVHDKIRDTLINAISVNCGYTTNVQPSLRAGELPVQTGNKTECALLGFVISLGKSYQAVRDEYPESELYKVYTFNSARKSMSTVVRKKFSSGFQIFTKGAPEILLEKCTTIIDENGERKPLTKLMITEITRNVIDAMAKMGLRTIAITYREFNDEPNWDNDAEIFSDMTCLAIVGIEDPLRNEVPQAIQHCHHAGVTVRMVTGDNINTATSIAQKCGILPPHEHNYYVFDSAEFNRRIRDRNGDVSQDKFDEIWPRLRVLARSSPQDKYILVKGIIDSHASEFREVVAVTGDGTNDGPALRKADVGFAMGVTGTEVAKEASDIILTDDNFSSIVQAIKWGRNVYDSISKFVQFQVTVNIVAVTLASISSIVISTSPIAALQMLWINLIMDTLAALCLATEKPSDDLLTRKPYGRIRPIVSPLMATTIGLTSVYQLIVLFTLTFTAAEMLDIDSNIIYINGSPGVATHAPTQHFTFVFNTLTMMILFNEFNCRKVHGERNVFTNLHNNYLFISIWLFCLLLQFLIIQFGGMVFETAPLTWDQWMWSLVFGVGSMIWYQFIVTFSVRLSKVRFSSWTKLKEEKDGY